MATSNVTFWVNPDQLVTSNVTDQWGATARIILLGTTLFRLVMLLFFITIHPYDHIVFWSQKVRRLLDEVTEVIDRLTASVYIKTILPHENKQNKINTVLKYISFCLYCLLYTAVLTLFIQSELRDTKIYSSSGSRLS